MQTCWMNLDWISVCKQCPSKRNTSVTENWWILNQPKSNKKNMIFSLWIMNIEVSYLLWEKKHPENILQKKWTNSSPRKGIINQWAPKSFFFVFANLSNQPGLRHVSSFRVFFFSGWRVRESNGARPSVTVFSWLQCHKCGRWSWEHVGGGFGCGFMLGKGCDESPIFLNLRLYLNIYIYIYVICTYILFCFGDILFLMTLLTVTLRYLDLPMNCCLG